MSDQNFEEYERDEEMLEARRRKRMEMKRKRKMQQRIALAVIAVVLIVAIVLIFKGCSKDSGKEIQEEEIIPPTPVEKEPEPEAAPDVKVTLAAVGDIMAYDTQIADAQQEDLSYNFADSFSAISAYTQSADLTVGNLETNFTGTAPYSGNKMSWNAPEILATNLKDIGFDVMLTANTYSIMNGMNGLTNTAKFLNAAGIDHVGTHISDPDATPGGGATMREVNGVKIAFIGFTKGLNGMSLPTNSEYCVDLLYTDYNSNFSKIDSSKILDRIDDAKALNPDVIIALCHWGSEQELGISDSQKDITDLMFKNGVDVILGTHSHVVGPMEFKDVTTKDGDEKTCFVAYSLGNFISDMDQYDYAMDSVILNLEFTKSGKTGETTITAANYTPLYILDAGEAEAVRFQVLPIRKAIDSKLFESYNPKMEEAINHLKTNTNSDFDAGN